MCDAEVAVERGLSAAEDSRSSSTSDECSYQETDRFCTWRKHVRDLYQQLFHIDLVWESPVAQLMPYVKTASGLTTHTILCGSRTGGQEQCYLQMLSATIPCDTQALDGLDAAYCEATGEVGGYGMAPNTCGLQIDRYMLHNGDVLAARYMPANPLLIASASSNGALYVFDWSRISLGRYPNDPPRPRAPLPPNELTSEATEEERVQYQKRMRSLNAVAMEQDRWDRRTGDGQHLLTLNGSCGPSDNLDWSVSGQGTVASGSTGRICVWEVANMSKDDPRLVDPYSIYHMGNEEDRVTHLQFSWTAPTTLVSTSSSGAVLFIDLRSPQMTEVFSIASAATCVALAPQDGNAMLVGDDEGRVFFFDMRKSTAPVLVEHLHSGEVTSLEYCPHSRHLFASGGHDGIVNVYNTTRGVALFRHCGHTDGILDLGWNWQEDCSGQLITADCNSIMLWRPRDYFFYA